MLLSFGRAVRRPGGPPPGEVGGDAPQHPTENVALLGAVAADRARRARTDPTRSRRAAARRPARPDRACTRPSTASRSGRPSRASSPLDPELARRADRSSGGSADVRPQQGPAVGGDAVEAPARPALVLGRRAVLPSRRQRARVLQPGQRLVERAVAGEPLRAGSSASDRASAKPWISSSAAPRRTIAVRIRASRSSSWPGFRRMPRGYRKISSCQPRPRYGDDTNIDQCM